MNAREWFYEMLMEYLYELARDARADEYSFLLRMVKTAQRKHEEEKGKGRLVI